MLKRVTGQYVVSGVRRITHDRARSLTVPNGPAVAWETDKARDYKRG